MTPRQKLIKICKLKARLIKEHTGIEDYFTTEDRKDIMSWEAKKCEEIINQMLFNFEYLMVIKRDSLICPWCIFYDYSPCSSCSYGKRHGICNIANSKYAKIIVNCKRSPYIISIPTLFEKINAILERG